MASFTSMAIQVNQKKCQRWWRGTSWHSRWRKCHKFLLWMRWCRPSWEFQMQRC